MVFDIPQYREFIFVKVPILSEDKLYNDRLVRLEIDPEDDGCVVAELGLMLQYEVLRDVREDMSNEFLIWILVLLCFTSLHRNFMFRLHH